MKASDYSFQQLPDANFRNQNLQWANFRHAYLHKADFSGADLRNADFTGADLRQAIFTEALIYGVNFDRADLTDCLRPLQVIQYKKRFKVYLTRTEEESVEVFATDKDDAKKEALELEEFSDGWEVETVIEVQVKEGVK